MQSVSKEKFQEALNNEYYSKILHKVCRENLNGVCNKDEIKSIMMNTLWDCLGKYNSAKNVKFSSYLYRSIQNNSRRVYKKKAKEFKNVQIIDNFHSVLSYDNKAKEEVRDILNDLQSKNAELHQVIIQKFYYRMTNKEIGEANGYGKEAARKKLKKAIELCRELCIL
jgi:RNA polymerase sigma factor (sigma-70 family)